MKKKVLLFNVNSAEERKKILKVFLPLKIGVEVITKEKYNQSIGFLVGLDQAAQVNDAYTGEELDGQMMVLYGVFGATMERALAALRKEGVGKDCLKSIVTATNSSWDVLKLYDELKKEHSEMSGS